MPNNTTAQLSDSIRVQYDTDYKERAILTKLYDQMAAPIGKDMANLKRGSSVSEPFLSSLDPTSQTISEVADVIPVQFNDTTVSITPTSRANAVIISEKFSNTAYTNFEAEYVKKVGENMMLSVDLLASVAANTGALAKSAAARSSLDAGTTAHRLSKAIFATASVMLTALKVPSFTSDRGSRWMAIMHPFAFADLMSDSTILAIGQYQDKNVALNFELGELNGFSLIVSPWAKMFWGSGAANSTAVATTLAAGASSLDTSITVAAAGSTAVGQRMLIGTVETANTHYATNESVIVKSVVSNTIGIIGEGENGGLRYNHAIGEAFKNNDNVASVVFGGPESLAKVYDTAVGEYGQIVGPSVTGLVNQFKTLGWKWYGGYGVIADSRVMRTEVSTSLDA